MPLAKMGLTRQNRKIRKIRTYSVALAAEAFQLLKYGKIKFNEIVFPTPRLYISFPTIELRD